MNGRLYDPVLHRFLQPDNYVQDPFNTQNFNRYGYVLNNPLKYTDPSGERAEGPNSFQQSLIGSIIWSIATNVQENWPEIKDWINKQAKSVEKWFEKQVDSIANWFKADTTPRTIAITPIQTPQNQSMSNQVDKMPGWEFYAGTGATIGKELYYSKTYGTWMGRNFKVYKQTWGGNKFTGGKNKFGKATAKKIGWAGNTLGAWNALSIETKRQRGEISNTQSALEQGSNAFSTFGGVQGAAWGVGWEFGRVITNTEWYQEFKYNFWYDRWEKKVGPPSKSNENFWYYFYNNYDK